MERESDARIVCGQYEKPLLAHNDLIKTLSRFSCPTAEPGLEFYLVVETGDDGIWEIFRGVVIEKYYNAGKYKCQFDDGVWPVHWKDSFNSGCLIMPTWVTHPYYSAIPWLHARARN